MKSLKEISNIFISSLAEGLLDDMEDTLSTGNDMMDEKLIESWAISKDYKVKKTKQGFKLIGNFVISGIKDEYYNGPKIKSVKGNLAIESTELINLKDIFAVDCIIEGTFSIENNKKLNSLYGCPLQVNTLVISGNKQLKELDLTPTVMMNAYIYKNGFKANKDNLAKTMQVFKHIYCAVHTDEDLINESILLEAIKAPQLKPIIKAVQQFNKVQHYNTQDREIATLSEIFQTAPWDKISSSQISEYDKNDSECIKLARKFISKRTEDFKIYGIMFLMNKEGEVTGAIADNYYYSFKVENYNWNKWNNTQKNGKYNLNRMYFKRTSDLLDFINETGCDTVIFIEFTPGQIQDIINLRQNRGFAKSGAIALKRGDELTGKADSTIKSGEDLLSQSWHSRRSLSDSPDIKQVRYYQSIVEENRERYKKMLDQIKAHKAAITSNFTSIKRKIDDAFTRYNNILEKIMKDPVKYSKESWEIESLQDHFSYVSTEGQGSNKYGVEQGLMRMLKLYTRTVLDAAKGYTYGNKNLQESLKNIEAAINKKLSIIESKLKSLESL